MPLQVHRFEAFSWDGKRWVAGNIMGRELIARDFSVWYPDGDRIVDGVICTFRDVRSVTSPP